MSITILKDQLKGLSVHAALIMLKTHYGMSKKTFLFDGEQFTVALALDVFEDLLMTMPCGELGVIRFFGGPPHEGKWFDGTILTMLCDAILFSDLAQNLPDDEKIYA